MRSAAAAVSVLALAMTGSAMAAGPSAGSSTPTLQAEGDFCAQKPADVDARIATSVNALSVSVPTTPPIAVLDTGVTGSVPEIGGRTATPFDATTGGTDGSDVDGHGTEVAGIAAGAPGLVAGISPTSPIMPVRVFNLSGETTAQWLVGGINWAVSNHAAVINISSASLLSDSKAADIALLTRATTDAFNHGTLVVASAGNIGNSQPQLPSSLPHVLAVGASDLAGNRATFSNTGPWVDLVSPAVSMVAPISTAFCPTGYAVANGTSFAAPAVAAAVALLAQVHPELSPQQRFDVIRTSAQDVAPAGRDDDTGFGMLNVQGALSAPAPAPELSREVDDDPYYVRGPNAAGHPLELAKTRKVRIAGSLSAAKDPSDVYRVSLKKGERFVASAAASGSDSLISLGLWKPTAGDFDVSNSVSKNEIVSSGGFAGAPELKMRAPKGGTYYVSVEAPDAVDPDDPTAIAPVIEPYKLVLSKQPPLKPKKKKTAPRKKKR